MHEHYEKHAKEVVQRFERMLEDSQIEAIGEEHFDELETLIAAALGVVDSDAKHAAAKAAEALAHELRKDASTVE